MKKRIFTALAVFTCILIGVITGSYFQVRALGSQDIWSDMKRIINRPNPVEANLTNHPNDPIQGDAAHRLIKYPNKQEVLCPAQTERTYVLLVSGQSNSANHGGQRFASEFGDKVINFHNGKCYIAKSPLLGSTGLEGESWTLLGNLLIKSGAAERVIITTTGVAGSAVSQWEAGGTFATLLLKDVQTLQSRYRVTHMFWHQGETDYGKRTSAADYVKIFTGLAEALRQTGMNAPIYVSNASQCWIDAHWHKDNSVVQAQKSLVNPEKNIRAGVDSDALMGEYGKPVLQRHGNHGNHWRHAQVFMPGTPVNGTRFIIEGVVSHPYSNFHTINLKT